MRTAAALAIAAACGTATAACNAMPGADKLEVERLVRLAWQVSAAVFSGQVTAIEYVPAGDAANKALEVQVVRVATGSWWRGMTAEEVTLHTNNYRNADGTRSREAHEFDYEVGKNYLIYAAIERGQLHASKCSRTRPLAAATADIAVLDELQSAAN